MRKEQSTLGLVSEYKHHQSDTASIAKKLAAWGDNQQHEVMAEYSKTYQKIALEQSEKEARQEANLWLGATWSALQSVLSIKQ